MWEADEDGVAVFTGQAVFPDVPLGPNDLVTLTITIGSDSRGHTQITGIEMNKPINSRRLKQLPIDAIRQRCAVLVREEEERIEKQLFGASTGEVHEAQKALRAYRSIHRSDSSSGDFHALVAAVSNAARIIGGSGWRAVQSALTIDGESISERTAIRYISNAKKAGFETGDWQEDDRVYHAQPVAKTSSKRRKKG
jgi:hypothetical protein